MFEDSIVEAKAKAKSEKYKLSKFPRFQQTPRFQQKNRLQAYSRNAIYYNIIKGRMCLTLSHNWSTSNSTHVEADMQFILCEPQEGDNTFVIITLKNLDRFW